MLAALRDIDWTGGAIVQDIETLGGMAVAWYDSDIDLSIEQAIARAAALSRSE